MFNALSIMSRVVPDSSDTMAFGRLPLCLQLNYLYL